MKGQHILVVDDEPDIRLLLQEILEDEGYAVSVAQNAEEARASRRARRPDLVLLDIWMPDEDGISLLKDWTETGGLPCPVIMMSGHGTVETAVEATRLGAYDFIEKPLSLAKLLLTLGRALEADQLQRENIDLKREAGWASEPIGSSETIRVLKDKCKRIAQHDSWVLMTGEPGVGKETFARYLHSLGPRRERPFVAVSVASLAHEGGAAALFGSERGGEVRYGLLEQASGGTLFLREVTDMDAGMQARLLSALENRSFARVGGSDPVSVDVQVIAGSHRDLEAEVRDNRFREDLYYRLNVVPLVVPPLRERPDDVSELLSSFVNLLNVQQGLSYREFTLPAQNFLRHYSWPGNVRELYNLVQRLLILGSGLEIGLEEVQAALGERPPEAQPTTSPARRFYDLPLREARENFEREYLLYQLQQTGGNVSKLAERVGMERTHLYRKMRSLDIDPKQVG
jgi:DNA-binding NtrC family response regulator